jgi:hypothetical protein
MARNRKRTKVRSARSRRHVIARETLLRDFAERYGTGRHFV